MNTTEINVFLCNELLLSDFLHLKYCECIFQWSFMTFGPIEVAYLKNLIYSNYCMLSTDFDHSDLDLPLRASLV